MAVKVTVTVVDVNGSFKRLCKESPRIARSFLNQAVQSTTVGVAQRMRARVPVDQGELKAAIDTVLSKGTRLIGYAGVFDDAQADIALYNEYAPNRQPFMVPAAEDEANAFEQRCKRALQQMEAALSRF